MDNERLFHINDDLRIVVRKDGQSTYVIIESDSSTIRLSVAKWQKFKKWFSVVDTEINLRLQNGLDR